MRSNPSIGWPAYKPHFSVPSALHTVAAGYPKHLVHPK